MFPFVMPWNIFHLKLPGTSMASLVEGCGNTSCFGVDVDDFLLCIDTFVKPGNSVTENILNIIQKVLINSPANNFYETVT